MTRGQRRAALALGLALLALASCQLVAGIESRKLDPVASGCNLPSGGAGPMVRVANLVPTSDLIDICMRPAGASDWGRPALLNGGETDGAPGCTAVLGTAGFAYTNVSVAFTSPAASIDVKFVAAGNTCGADALAEGDNFALATNAVTTLMYLGGNGTSASVVAQPESDTPNGGNERFRFVHAAPGTGPLDFGLTQDPHLPTTVAVPLLSAPLAFAATTPGGATSPYSGATVDDHGYLSVFNGQFSIGASIDGTNSNAVFAFQYPNGAATYSMYAIGVGGDLTHPLRALVCGEDSTLGTPASSLLIGCAASTLSSLSVDVFNPALYGPNSPNFVPREGLVPDAIAARNSDVMCLVEVDLANDQAEILKKDTAIEGGTGPYPYVYTVTTDLSTPFSDPKDWNGNVPAPPTEPPCSGVATNLVSDPVTCAEQSCSNSPGDPSGTLFPSTDCLISNCAGQFVTLENTNTACFDCLVVYLASDATFSDAQNNCTTDGRAPLGFSGAENSMILSKYPLNNTDALILPSTLYRRSVLYAQVQLEDQSVDFYCGFLMTTLNDQALPYNGNYGAGPIQEDAQHQSLQGWENEQALEAVNLAAWVNSKSGSNPAVLVGDWRSSIGVPADAGTPPAGGVLPTDLNPATMRYFQGGTLGSNQGPSWTFAAPPSTFTGWGPQCNYCPQQENPYNLTDSFFVSQPMLVNWPANATLSEQLLYTKGVTSFGAEAGALAPISPYYGVNVVLARPK